MTQQILASLIPFIVIGILAFWKPNAVLFMVMAGISIYLGLNWFDFSGNNLGLSIGLMLVVFSFFCIGMAFRMLFFNRGTEANELSNS